MRNLVSHLAAAVTGAIALWLFLPAVGVDPTSPPGAVPPMPAPSVAESPQLGEASSPAAAVTKPTEESSPARASRPPADEWENAPRERLLAEVRRRHAEAEESQSAVQSHYDPYSAAELRALADHNEVQVRLPQLAEPGVPYGEEARAAVGLTEAEHAELERIYAASTKRLHDGLRALHAEQGGDEGVAAAMAPNQLLETVMAQATPGDDTGAVKLAARERAGLEPPATQASVALRAYRLLAAEDTRVLEEVHAQLGATRASTLLNHKSTRIHRLSVRNFPQRNP